MKTRKVLHKLECIIRRTPARAAQEWTRSLESKRAKRFSNQPLDGAATVSRVVHRVQYSAALLPDTRNNEVYAFRLAPT